MIAVSYELFLALIGLGILGAALTPAITLRFGLTLPVSLPIMCLGGGLVAGLLLDEPRMDLIANGPLIARVTEIAVLLSLTGCGLKLDRPLGLRSWATTWRLLGITMPLSIALMALGGWAIMGLAPAVALLLAACLAPTDPVLAASVQVGPPGEQEEADTRFALTSEAGLNDGLAFPFVHLALVAAAAFAGASAAPGDEGRFTEHVVTGWLAVDVAWKLGMGIAVGWAVGAVLGWIMFRFAPGQRAADAFLSIGLTLFCYGLTELLHGYGFLAVFLAALTFRRSERNHAVHGELHHFVEQIELLVMICVVFITGIALSQGLLEPLGWRGLLLAVLFLAVIRPVAGWVGLAGSSVAPAERFAISVLGIRGVGAFYYLSYGLSHAPFSIEAGQQMWAVAGLIVALSVVLHGLTAPALMGRLQAGSTRVGDLIRRR